MLSFADARKMLVKWAIEGERRKTAKTQPSTMDEVLRIRAASSDPKVMLGSSLSTNNRQDPLAEPETTAQVLGTQLGHLDHLPAFARTEDEGDRTLSRIQAQERDTKSRDDKLLSLVGIDQNSSKDQETSAYMPLTEENIEKLVHGQEDAESSVQQAWTLQGANSSTAKEPRNTLDGKQEAPTRPALREMRLDSEQTVTGHMTK